MGIPPLYISMMEREQLILFLSGIFTRTLQMKNYPSEREG